MTVDISREAVQHLCDVHRGYMQTGTVATLLTLRDALDRAEADKAAMVFVPPHLVDELAEWVLSEQAHWPEDTAYQSDLATFSASLRDLGGAL